MNTTATIPIDGLTPAEKAVLLRDLKTAYYSGATRIKFRERDVSYRSLAEMRQIISDLESEMGAAPRSSVVLTTFGRGY